jgi:hypothetical protein
VTAPDHVYPKGAVPPEALHEKRIDVPVVALVGFALAETVSAGVCAGRTVIEAVAGVPLSVSVSV